MIDTELTTLLSAYGDALEATHPVPSVTTEHERLAGDGPTALQLGQADFEVVDDVFTSPAPGNRPRMATMLALAAATIAICVFAVSAIGSDSLRTADLTESNPLVFPGEVVLRTDPLVVIAAPAQELRFDPTTLGTEITFDSVESLSSNELDEAIEGAINAATFDRFSNIDLDVRKLTLLWDDDEALYALGVADGVIVAAGDGDDPTLGFGPPGSTVRFFSTISGPNGGGGADVIEDVEDLTGIVVPLTIAEHLEVVDAEGRYPIIDGARTTGTEFALEYKVAQEVAVVQLIVGDTATWMRPIGGQVILSGKGDHDTQIELVTYNADGEELTRRLATVEGS